MRSSRQTDGVLLSKHKRLPCGTPLDETPTEDSKWLPLGVFALVQDGEANWASLKVLYANFRSQKGTIAGTYNNSPIGISHSQLKGAVDKDSQRAAWGSRREKRLAHLSKSGISNLN